MPTERCEIGFKVKVGAGNLASHIRWMEWLVGSEFSQEIANRYHQSTHLQRLVTLAREVINEQIYSISRGEGYIEESIKAKFSSGNGGIASVSVFLDPAISGAKGPVEGMDENQVSYAAFFERPEFNSFLLGKGQDIMNPIKHRPFFDAWTQSFQEHEEKELLRSLRLAMKSKMPRPLE